MKPSPLRSLATHLVGVAAGGALAYALVAAPRHEDQPPPPKHRSTTLAARFSPTVALELERLMEKVEEERDATLQQQGLTVRELNLQAIDKQQHVDRENEKELRRLQTIAGTFVENKNLGPELTDALATGDEDLARALFLEWHRRDPPAAFDALARRSTWLESIDEIIARAIPNDQLIAQIAREDRPQAFRERLAKQLGAKLGASDNLPELTRALDGFPSHHRTLFESFIDSWVPDNGTEAARFIGFEMKPGHQAELLEAIVDRHSLRAPEPWTDAFATALFDYDLHVSRGVYHELRTRAAARSEAAFTGWPSSAPSVTPDLDSAAALNAMVLLLDDPMHRERDYPELFAAGEIDMDALLSVAHAGIPGAEHFPEAMKRALFLKLAPHNPARAITWATSAIPRARLNQDINRLFLLAIDSPPFPRTDGFVGPSVWSPGFEPRTRQLADLAAVLLPSHAPDAETSAVAGQLRARFDDWSRLAPASAKPFTDRFAPDHHIWNAPLPETAGP
jgi:hypothetical protein